MASKSLASYTPILAQVLDQLTGSQPAPEQRSLRRHLRPVIVLPGFRGSPEWPALDVNDVMGA